MENSEENHRETSELLAFIKAGDTSGVEGRLSELARDCRTYDQWYEMSEAVKYCASTGLLDMMQLIAGQVPLSILVDVTRGGIDPLIEAAITCQTAVIEYLITFGVKLDKGVYEMFKRYNRDNMKDFLIGVSALLASGASQTPDFERYMGELKPLILVILGDVLHIMEQVLDGIICKKSEPSETDTANDSSVITVKHKDLEVVTCLIGRLIEKNRVTNKREYKAHNFTKTILMFASARGHPGVVRQIVNHNVNVNSRDLDGRTALMYAIEKGHLEVVKILLDEGNADVHLNTYKFESPLMFVPFNGVEIARLLIERGCSVHLQDLDGKNAMNKLLARRPCSDESEAVAMFDLLIEHGSPVNCIRVHGTPLVLAVCNRNADVVDLLIRKGADVNYKENYHGQKRTALKWAIMAAQKDRRIPICKLLLEAGIKIDGEVHVAIFQGDYALVKMLIQSGASPQKYIMEDECNPLPRYKVHFHFLRDMLTPLMAAFLCLEIRMVHLILELNFLDEYDYGCLFQYSYIRKSIRKHLMESVVLCPFSPAEECLEIYDKMFTEPKSLWKAAFNAVSRRMGWDRKKREKRISESGLPGALQRKLLFQ